jgi:hypothetical protein
MDWYDAEDALEGLDQPAEPSEAAETPAGEWDAESVRLHVEWHKAETRAESAAAQLRAVEGERDAAEQERDDWRYSAEGPAARAESAEAAHESLRARVEALAEEAKARKAAYPGHPHWAAWDACESDLRALLLAGGGA